ncbi:ras association domain-containing protein 6-like [Melospiza georgiana]|uniref:ras association domain-containing protein 6-like n=1 Tax=Melospiza georgiana TaxID=44398 RepID=UPI0025AC3573|nr:ras association domain-containing protein 6-like [Melospiza georgiana]
MIPEFGHWRQERERMRQERGYGKGYPCYESHTLRSRREQELDCATLPRSSSDAAAVRRRTKLPTITRTEVETHRFSINGHFYNHEIENSPHEFALYVIHASGEKKQLRSRDVPLLHRLLQGPSEKVAKFFLMDRDVEEISSDVAQYISFHLPFLESILHRINEEEKQEIQQTTARYTREKRLIQQHLRSRSVQKTETTV